MSNLHEIRIVGDAVWFYVDDDKQHAWDTGSRRGNIRAARAYLQAVGAVAVEVQEDGVSGWWWIETSDGRAHIEDDMRSANFKI